MHVILELLHVSRGFPGDAVAKNLPANAGDTRVAGFIPGWARSSGGGNDNPLQYSCLENSMDSGASGACGVTKSRTPDRVTEYPHTCKRSSKVLELYLQDPR